MNRTYVRVGILAACVVAAALACSSDSDSITDPTAPVSLELFLTPALDTIFITDTLTGAEIEQLSVSAVSLSRPVPTPAGRVFESQDPTVATVDSASGLVRAVAVGTADIVVRVNGVRAHATIVVAHPTSRVLVVPGTADILEDNAFGLGDTTRVRAQAYGADGKPLKGVRYIFTSSDTSVAVVDATGKVQARRIGAATITATANGLTGAATIRALRATRSLTMTLPAADSILVDNPIGSADTLRIQVVAKDSVANTRTGVQLVFTSADPTIVTIDPSGLVSAKALGTPTVSAMGADLTAVKPISVLSLAKTVTLSATATSWLVGDTIPLTASALGWRGSALTGRKYAYRVTAGSATVDTTGRAMFTAPGAASFSATTAFTTAALSLTAFPREFISAGPGSFSTGGDATCGLLPLNRVYCFGTAPLIGIARDTSCFDDATNPVLPPRPCTLIPLRIAGNLQMASVSVGDSVACGLDVSGRAYCWGDQTYGEVGNGISRPGTSSLPALVLGPIAQSLTFIQVSAGQAHACGIDPRRQVYCWGKDSTFQLGGADGARAINSSTPIPVLPAAIADTMRFNSVSAGGAHTCVLRDSGMAYCWGLNTSGQLGRGTIGGSSDVPTAVATSLTFVQLSAGSKHTCGVTAGQDVYCWGANDSAQVGQSVTPAVPTPTLVPGGGGYSMVSSGAFHSCALRSGSAYCWGLNSYGQLGRGSVSPALSPVPTLVQGSNVFATIDAGRRTTCAFAANGLYCWGSTILGAMGSQLQALVVPIPTKTATPQ